MAVIVKFPARKGFDWYGWLMAWIGPVCQIFCGANLAVAAWELVDGKWLQAILNLGVAAMLFVNLYGVHKQRVISARIHAHRRDLARHERQAAKDRIEIAVAIAKGEVCIQGLPPNYVRNVRIDLQVALLEHGINVGPDHAGAKTIH